MVPSALRTLSVVTLLSAVSGTVFLVHEHAAGSTGSVGASAAADSIIGFGGAAGSSALAADVLAITSIPAPRVETADNRRQLQSEALALRAEARAETEAELRAKAKAEAKARAEAKAKTKKAAAAAAERRRQELRQKASRSARRDPQVLARIMAADRGWGAGQFSCLKSLWTKESGWNYRAMNPSSGAYGIPQALPGSKMASAGSDWRTNPATQIEWGLDYIGDRYGTPCGAWGHSQSSGWY